MKGTLYLTPVPIGNYDDITIRGLNTLKEAAFIVCEEFKPAARLLSHFGIEKELIEINEHNEKEHTPGVIKRMQAGESAALISDGGTPLFSDPGHYLLDTCIAQDIPVTALPGASSLLPALTASGFDIEQFYYYGWLSPKKPERRHQLTRLRGVRELLVMLETPYRLKQVVSDCALILGEQTPCVVAYKLTMPEEKYFRGTLGGIASMLEEKKIKGEFVLLIDNRRKRKK